MDGENLQSHRRANSKEESKFYIETLGIMYTWAYYVCFYVHLSINSVSLLVLFFSYLGNENGFQELE